MGIELRSTPRPRGDTNNTCYRPDTVTTTRQGRDIRVPQTSEPGTFESVRRENPCMTDMVPPGDPSGRLRANTRDSGGASPPTGTRLLTCMMPYAHFDP